MLLVCVYLLLSHITMTARLQFSAVYGLRPGTVGCTLYALLVKEWKRYYFYNHKLSMTLLSAPPKVVHS
jgi:hypothetical protein